MKFTGVTDGAGNYTVLSLPPGIYSVTVSAPGFAPARIDHAVLAIDQQLALNISPPKVGAALPLQSV